MAGESHAIYKVLSPWAEADPIPLKGLAPRINSLAGKKIGLLRNGKRAGEPILTVTEKILRTKFPTAEFSWFRAKTFSVSELEKDRRQEFEDWIQRLDAVVAAVGD
jgi:hypothetical protein